MKTNEATEATFFSKETNQGNVCSGFKLESFMIVIMLTSKIVVFPAQQRRLVSRRSFLTFSAACRSRIALASSSLLSLSIVKSSRQ